MCVCAHLDTAANTGRCSQWRARARSRAAERQQTVASAVVHCIQVCTPATLRRRASMCRSYTEVGHLKGG
eukprot:1854721-Alexandrium_andersonii.AAC.1